MTNGVILTKKNEIKIPIEFSFADDFSNHRALVGLDFSFGYIDETGKEIIPIQYISGRKFQEGFAAVMNEQLKWGFIDISGDMKVPFIYDHASDILHGRALVEKDGKMLIIAVSDENLK